MMKISFMYLMGHLYILFCEASTQVCSSPFFSSWYKLIRVLFGFLKQPFLRCKFSPLLLFVSCFLNSALKSRSFNFKEVHFIRFFLYMICAFLTPCKRIFAPACEDFLLWTCRHPVVPVLRSVAHSRSGL